MRYRFLLPLFLFACSEPQPTPIYVHHTGDLSYGVEIAVADLVADLRRLGGQVFEKSTPAPPCRSGRTRLMVLDNAEVDQISSFDPRGLAEQGYVIKEERCTAGRRIVIAGGGQESTQWAVYDFLRLLGIRYFHPERTWYPDTMRWPTDPIDIDTEPAFARRSLHLHRTHPVELSTPLEPHGLDMNPYFFRWVDWNVKLRQTSVDGVDGSELTQHALARGFLRQAELELLSMQQGGKPLLDPDDPRPEEEIIAAAIDERMAAAPELGPIDTFGFSFNASEFTEEDDIVTVNRITFISDYLKEHYPWVQQWAINHGTAGGPTPNYGVRFYDLIQFAPPALGAKVHLLMFYGLDRPAPVYGNEDFTHQRQWIEAQAQVRRVIYYPESSWWLTFDLPVPLYLAPATLEARGRDMEIIRPLVVSDPAAITGVIGHHLFSSGQEWGYWLIDWCVTHMSWDLDYTYLDCLDDFTAIMEHGEVVRKVLQRAAERQAVDMRDPELIRFLVGSDDETELADEAGIVMHPLPPAPAEVLKWTDTDVDRLKQQSLLPLWQMAADYHRWAGQVAAILPQQNDKQAPWVREVHDGLLVFALRAEHAAELYGTVLDLRAALAAGDLTAVDAAAARSNQVQAITDRAREVVRARERDYRYPEELTIVGDEIGTPGAIENRTTYPYRYLSRTHRMLFWTRPDAQLAELFGTGLELVRANARILPIDQPLEITLVADEISELRLDYGDGSVTSTLAPYSYAAQGPFQWHLTATGPGMAISHDDEVWVVQRRFVFRKGSLKINEPAGASIIESVIPGFVAGLGEDGEPCLVIGRIDDAGDIATPATLLRRQRHGNSSGPADLSLEILGAGRATVYDADIEIGDGNGPTQRTLAVTGNLRPVEIAQILVDTGAFDMEGAIKMVAVFLGYSTDTLPETLAARITAIGYEGMPQ